VNKQVSSLSGEVAKNVSLDSAIPVEGRAADTVESSVSLKGDMTSMNPIRQPLANAETHTNYYAKQYVS
jgi:hypothetical protein